MAYIKNIAVNGTTYDIYDTRLGTDTTPTFNQTQANWTQGTTTDVAYIQNKPAIWASTDQTVPDGQTYGNSGTVTTGAVKANRSNNQAKGNYSFVEGYSQWGNKTVTINGVSTTIPVGASGDYSHAEGYSTAASGTASHAEGYSTAASGTASHAEGNSTAASGDYSHAEGYGTVIEVTLAAADAGATTYTLLTPYQLSNTNIASANRIYVVARSTTGASWTVIKSEKITARTFSGNNLTGFTVANSIWPSNAISDGAAVRIALQGAKNNYAHVQGLGTVSNSDHQHVAGKWNVQTAGAEVIGNGTDDLNRSNIRVLDWSGNESLAGSLTLGKGTSDETTITAAQLKQLLALLS